LRFQSTDCDSPDFAKGEVVLQRFELEERIARGGMGEIWRARHTTLGCLVAVKVSLKTDAQAAARFSLEARIGATLVSPYVCRVTDAGEHLGRSLLVMEYLQGQELSERLLCQGRLPPREVINVLDAVTRGLACAHQAGVIHRDIKPSNIFLERRGPAKLLDFGVARAGEVGQTRSGEFLGTLHYVSPEQVRDSRNVGPASDLWSLAMVAYECVVGERPFGAIGPAELVDRI
jgi:serine/threonine-protein kinase